MKPKMTSAFRRCCIAEEIGLVMQDTLDALVPEVVHQGYWTQEVASQLIAIVRPTIAASHPSQTIRLLTAHELAHAVQYTNTADMLVGRPHGDTFRTIYCCLRKKLKEVYNIKASQKSTAKFTRTR